MRYEDIIGQLSVTVHERKGLVVSIGESGERSGWDSEETFLSKYRQGFLGPSSVKRRFRDYCQTELRISDESYANHVIGVLALEQLSLAPAAALEEGALAEAVSAAIRAIMELPDAWTRLAPARIEAYRTVLEAAWLDGIISADEMNLLRRIRDRFQLSAHAHWVIEKKARAYIAEDADEGEVVFPPRDLISGEPQAVDAVTIQERLGKKGAVRYALIRNGLLFPVTENLPDGRSKRDLLALPDEIANCLRTEVFERELKPAASSHMLETEAIGGQDDLIFIAERFQLPRAKTLEERRDHILSARVQPTKILTLFAAERPEKLEALANELGCRVFKHARRNIESIVSHLQELPDWRFGADPQIERLEKLVENYVAIANRDYAVLRDRKVIQYENDVDHHFEDATHFLFNSYFGRETTRAGRDYEDGRVPDGDGRCLLWDTKSVETEKGHQVSLSSFEKQFEGYVSRARKKQDVLGFLVIAPSFTGDTGFTAMNLEVKWECEVPVIQADDFLWLAMEWKNSSAGKAIDLSFFSSSGVLTRGALEQRLALKDWTAT